jgi:hypothetical protein
MQCIPVEAHRLFGGTYYLHFQGKKKLSQVRHQQETSRKQSYVVSPKRLCALGEYAALYQEPD